MAIVPKLAAAFIVVASSATLAGPVFAQPALRCGWFVNPTPGNAWLTDRDGEWLIGVQGGNQAEGDWPTFAKGQWVRRQASYGYGCACIRMVADPVTKDVKEILSATARPLKACREDRALKEPAE